MRGVAGQEQPAMLHGLEHTGAQRCYGHFEGGPAGDAMLRQRVEAQSNFVPETLLGPVLDPVGQRDLDLVAAAGRRAHRGEREAARAVRVNQFVAAMNFAVLQFDAIH